MISAVILAAGASRRMGSPKALLTHDGRTFLRRIDDVLMSVRVTSRVIVLGADEALVRPSLSWFSGLVAVNHGWEQGQLSSILTGIAAVEASGCDGVMIWPVDRPLVSAAVCAELLQAFWTSGKEIIVPVFGDKRGHPVIFSASLFPELRSAPPEAGARALLQKNPGRIHHCRVEDPGILQNIDTPEDLARLAEGHRS